MFAAGNDPHAYAMVHRYMRRPAEELYHTSEDPFEKDNLNRTIVAPDMELLKTAREVVVSLDLQGRKVYTIEEGGGS